MKIHTLDQETVLAHLATSASGLSTEEARRRVQEYGPNEIVEAQAGKPLPPFACIVDEIRLFVTDWL